MRTVEKSGAPSSIRVFLHNFTDLPLPNPIPPGLVPAPPLASPKDAHPFSVLLLDRTALEPEQDYDFLFQHVGVIYRLARDETAMPWVDIALEPDGRTEPLRFALEHILRVLRLKEQCLMLHNACAITEARNRQLNQIGTALMSEKDPDNLLRMILDRAMTLTGSDAGCLYLVETTPGIPEESGDYWANKQIRFKLTRNLSVPVDFSEKVVDIGKGSIVGHTLLEGKALSLPDVYQLEEGMGFRHNRGFDQTSGYVTRSMLTLPMKDKHGQVIGAIQLINKCRMKRAPVTSATAADEQVIPYRQEDLNLSLSLASQASVALLNAQHEQEVKRLFEGFIMASVTAIESRDPTTSGHSQRVGAYSVKLAESLDRLDTGRFAPIRFKPEELRQLRYAALLHDFGKIGVREHILTKSKKLFPDEVHALGLRLDRIRAGIRWETAEAKLALLRDRGGAEAERRLEFLLGRERERLAEIETLRQAVLRANEPGPLAAEIRAVLERYRSETFADPGGENVEFLQDSEIRRLCIPSGTLSAEERDEIQSHVTHTFKFLSRIPWTRDLQQVPGIAHAHHEKLDGTGYPLGLKEADIPLPSKIMAICDIYDALAAKDRPYKRALPVEKALGILESEAKAGLVDIDLFHVFVDSRVYQASAENGSP
jgi:HD-GYP domain-containing protein (c-di-GMP phosphodiesterase class II)